MSELLINNWDDLYIGILYSQEYPKESEILSKFLNKKYKKEHYVNDNDIMFFFKNIKDEIIKMYGYDKLKEQIENIVMYMEPNTKYVKTNTIKI